MKDMDFFDVAGRACLVLVVAALTAGGIYALIAIHQAVFS